MNVQLRGEFSPNTFMETPTGRFYFDGALYCRRRYTSGGWFRDHLGNESADCLFVSAVIAAWIFLDGPYRFVDFVGVGGSRQYYTISEVDLRRFKENCPDGIYPYTY